MLKLRGEAGLEGAELRHRERCDVHCGRSVNHGSPIGKCRIRNISSYGICKGSESLPAPGGAPPELDESDVGIFVGGILVVMVN